MEFETDQPTRERVARSILEQGPSTAAALAARLDLTPAAVRRHLDHLVAEGAVEARDRPTGGARHPRPWPSGQGVRDHRDRSRPLRPAVRRPRRPGAAVPGRDRRRRGGPGLRRPADVVHRGAVRRRGGRPARPDARRGAGRVFTDEGYVAVRELRRAERASARAARHVSSCQQHPVSHVPTSSPSCARPRPRRSAGCSAATCSGWPPSPTATGCAPPASRHRPTDKREKVTT